MSEETELIKDRIDVADIVGEYVSLRPAGQNMKGLCPFHQEKSPSFTVSPARRTWHCFGCGEGGDIFTFIEKIEGVDFPAALKQLAERAGVQLKGRQPETSSRRQRLFDVLAAAARIYHEILMRQNAGKKAKAYLEKRGVLPETMDRFLIGYAVNDWDSMQKLLIARGFTEEEMIQSGLAGRSQGGKVYDRFRGRIMFPIADTQGRVVAFGGRIVPWHETGNEGKYVNSPETALYEKRKVVYNLDRAKKALRHNQPCLVVEGYMDVAMLVQAGIEHVVATSGTAFTEDHVKQISRFTKTIHFAFDADAAGWKATIAATQAALASGLQVATVVLPPGKDPADLVLEGPGSVRDTMGKTHSLLSVLISQLKQAGSYEAAEDQLQALLPLLRLVANPIQQGSMVQEISEALHVPETRVFKLLEAISYTSSFLPQASQERQEATASLAALPEYQLLGLVISDLQARSEVFARIEADFLLDPASQKLYNSLQRLATSSQSFLSLSADELISALDPAMVSFAEGVRASAEELIQTSNQLPAAEGRSLLRSLHRRYLKSRLTALQQELMQSKETDRLQKMQQFQALAEALARVDNM